MSQLHNPGGFDRGAKTDLRQRRAIQELQAAVEQGTLLGVSPGGGLGYVGDPALLTVITQTPLFTDAMGVGLNFVAPLILSGDDLDIALTAPIILDAGAIALDFGAGLDAPGGVLAIDLDANSGLQVGGSGLSIDLSQSPSLLELTAGGLGTRLVTAFGATGVQIQPTGAGVFRVGQSNVQVEVGSGYFEASITDNVGATAAVGSPQNNIAFTDTGVFMAATDGFELFADGSFGYGMIQLPGALLPGSRFRGAPGGPVDFTGDTNQTVTLRGHDGVLGSPAPGPVIVRGGNRATGTAAPLSGGGGSVSSGSSTGGSVVWSGGQGGSSGGAGGAGRMEGGQGRGTNIAGGESHNRGGRPTGSGASRALMQATANNGSIINGVEVRIEPSSTTAVQLGFYGVTPVSRPDVTGARDDPEAALANLLTALENLGIITDSTTAS